ncbi:MAG: Ig-like domain-containing protein, partial [Actinomycetaceae bacterium]|nr:Ig-like domain-containing protein [Actinomycetaceae bacterium]
MMTGRFSTKLLAVVAALSLMGSGVAVADETTDTSGAPGVEVSAEPSTPEVVPSTPEVTPSAEPTEVVDDADTDAKGQLDIFDVDLSDVLADTGGALPVCSEAEFGKVLLKGPSTLIVGQVDQTMVTLEAPTGDQFNLPHNYFDDAPESLWSSSNNNVATVNKYGDVTGKSPGTANITLASEAQKTSADNVTTECQWSASYTVTVVQPVVKVSSVGVSGKSKVQIGKKIALKANIAPSNATNKGVSWKSSNTKI